MVVASPPLSVFESSIVVFHHLIVLYSIFILEELYWLPYISYTTRYIVIYTFIKFLFFSLRYCMYYIL